MAKDVFRYIQLNCPICLAHRNSNQKEPLTPHETSSYIWQVISSDLFTWDDKEYLVMVDHLSRFFEVFRLQNTKGTDVIIRMIETFARLGIPEKSNFR